MTLSVTSGGNAAVYLKTDSAQILIDPFFQEVGGVGGRPVWFGGAETPPANLVLITHAHPDHLDTRKTLAYLKKSSAVLAGPEAAVRFFRQDIPAERLLSLEPREGKKPPDAVEKKLGELSLTAFRTYHASGHNSYLLEMPGVRVYHDADNELTQPLDIARLGQLDALFLCPWAGSGAGELLSRLKPGKWFLIHMNDSEISDHRAGYFLPGLISPVPSGVVALSPGEKMEI
ncbi:MAG: MBL fold metallo-hydrolase [Planctomycetota bacterium]|jgi:L-ascorbate metabolism protein UlaG (beta-lactamase superfamily)|nr:MBL fold metallo-hydrolase [Planctomycetota bacterium]